jgi:tetratricopeptide (TPR) repeat protein
MTVKDVRGHALSGANETSAELYGKALRQLNLYQGDPVATIDAALAESPDFVMAHAMRAWLHLLGTEPAGLPVAKAALDAAIDLPATLQEQGHLAAITQLANGGWHAASRTLEDVTIDHPHDLLALQAGHQIDFFTGNARMLRDRISRALPVWSKAVPGYHNLLGMHAFGLEEMGQYAQAEASGRAAVEHDPHDSWAQHAVAHVLEMQGRQHEGIGWMRTNPQAWSHESFFAVHNWWHLALYHLDLGETDEVLKLFDGPIYGARSQVIVEMIDASALLWRLHLRGIDVGDRWQHVADAWAPVADAGLYAFNDAHAMMAFVGAGRRDLVQRVLDAQAAAMQRPDDNAAFTREVGQPLTKSIKAFGNGDYAEAVRLIRPVRGIAARFGGSHAQRDVFDLTLVEAAFRSGQLELARALSAERIHAKPESPLARLFARRSGLELLAA